MASDGPLDAAGRVIEVLEGLGIPYMVVGSVACSVHGIPRATMDVDIVAGIRNEHVAPFVEALQGDFHVDRDMICEAILHRSSFNVIHLGTLFKTGVFVPLDDNVSRTEMARRRRHLILEGSDARWYVASPEDTILRKMHWFREGGELSDRQWQDILGIFQVQRERLRLRYLRDAARLLGVSDLVERALDEAELA
ncbi:MAG: hypothetical protein AB1646_18395 [Thermodesulfobacteriota bacterium]